MTLTYAILTVNDEDETATMEEMEFEGGNAVREWMDLEVLGNVAQVEVGQTGLEMVWARWAGMEDDHGHSLYSVSWGQLFPIRTPGLEPQTERRWEVSLYASKLMDAHEAKDVLLGEHPEYSLENPPPV